MRYTIMVIDDDKSNLTAAKILLEGQYEVSLVNSGIRALKLLEKYKPDLILLDLKMPDMDGFEVIDIMKSNERLKDIPVIILTADKSDETERECFIHGAVDYIGKPFKAAVMLARVHRTLELENLRNDLACQVEKKTKELEAVVLQSVMAIANTVDSRSEFKRGHSARVAEYSLLIGRKMGLRSRELKQLYQAALLHDIGKIGIPDSILNKPGRLSAGEMDVIRRHPNIGADILKDIQSMKDVSISVRFHHERFDGEGYPSGISGDDIPVLARIICIADAYEAMTHDRVYRGQLSDHRTQTELEQEKGGQFDPKLVDILIELIAEHGSLRQFTSGREVEPDSNGNLVQRILEKQSETDRNEAALDWLTGLYNRSFSEREIIRRIRKEDGAFFLIDLDNFKMVNDFYGHAAGDAVLKRVAVILKSCIGEDDLASRVGGDEFTIFISGVTDRDRIVKYAEHILEEFNKEKKAEALLAECSLSIGISFASKDSDGYLDIYKKADRALYYVKQNGKNGFEFYNEKHQDLLKKSSDGIAELQRFMRLLENEKTKKGVYEVGYREISRTLKLVSRFVERNDQNLQLVLFTLVAVSTNVDLEQQQEAMSVLEEVIYQSLRKVDISTRYSSSQHMVVLVDADEQGIEIVAKRIKDEFKKNNHTGNFEILYDFLGIGA